jgi:hypothetical protein
MEKFMYPCKNIRITQGYGVGTHKSSYAIDEGEIDTGRSTAFAPYSGVVKVIYSQYENQVFFESDNPVQFADGTIDYAITLFEHQNSPMAYGMKVGKHYNQGEPIYVEGGRYAGINNQVASHIHMEFARGKYQRWYKNASGIYSLRDAKKPQDCCFIDNSYHVIDDCGYGFVNLDNLLKYRAHCEHYGWMDWKQNGETAGTTGEALRLEAIQIDFHKEVEAKAHLQDLGWVDYGKINKDTVIGTTNEARRLECLCLKGDFEYRVHLQDTGWTCWTHADGICTLGSVGECLRIEAIEIKELG